MKNIITGFSLFVLVLSLSCSLASELLNPDSSLVTEISPVFTQEAISPTSNPTPSMAATSAPSKDNLTSSSQLLQASDFTYQGAFRLPSGDTRPKTFLYGGNAMTFNPKGEFLGAAAHLPGSLFISGHDRMSYGELPDGGQIAEINIPKPAISKDIQQLLVAEFIQNFQDVTKGFFIGLDEIPRMGMAYLDTPATGAKIHLAWGQHLEPDTAYASHAWFDIDLSHPNTLGTWFIGEQSLFSVNGYIFEIPADWAEKYSGNKPLATGRYRDGGWSGMGPSLYAYQPWIDESGTPAISGAHLEEFVLLHYDSSETAPPTQHSLNNYQHPDEWEGGAWLTTNSSKTAVLFAGTKSNGTKYWYGYVNPSSPEKPCVEVEMVGQFTLCYLADGSPCPEEDLHGCEGHNDYRGWWSTHSDAQFILYNPDDLAQVASGKLESWQPQPYLSIDIDDYMVNNPNGVEQDMLGTGDQRRFRIGDVAYDRENGFLYVLELFADEAKPIVHIWKVN